MRVSACSTAAPKTRTSAATRARWPCRWAACRCCSAWACGRRTWRSPSTRCMFRSAADAAVGRPLAAAAGAHPRRRGRRADARRGAALWRAGGAVAVGLAAGGAARAAAPGQPIRHGGDGAEAVEPTASSWTPASPSASTSAVVAEGGVFAEQARKAMAHDYGQTAWVGTVDAARRHARAGGRALHTPRPAGVAAAARHPAPAGAAAPRWSGACPPTTTRWPAR